jgi:hypothetical protein
MKHYVQYIFLYESFQNNYMQFFPAYFYLPVTVAERSQACTVFAPSEAGIVVSNPKQGMDVWCVCVGVCVCVCVCVYFMFVLSCV